ncbi:MAG: hypothetical protein ACPL7G_10510 [Chloroflexia bacterium]
MRTRHMLLPVFLLLVLLSACGGQAAPTAPVAALTAPVEGTRPATAATPIPTQPPQPTPLPTQPSLPTSLPTEPAPATPGAAPDLSAAQERIQTLPGFHYEGFLKGQETGESPVYLRFVEDVDAQGNFHLLIYEEEGGSPTLDVYYIQKHFYLGSEGTYIDLGVREESEAADFYQTYMIPFSLLFHGASNLEPIGQETVNGLPATKYRANFEEWIRAYLQAQTGVSYTAEGYVWIADQYGAVVKSQVRASWSAEGKEGQYEAETEISRVGQIPTISLPR